MKRVFPSLVLIFSALSAFNWRDCYTFHTLYNCLQEYSKLIENHFRLPTVLFTSNNIVLRYIEKFLKAKNKATDKIIYKYNVFLKCIGVIF